MNTRHYIGARIFDAIGIKRKTKRLRDATRESYLLQMAEEIMGELAWRNFQNSVLFYEKYQELEQLHIDRDVLTLKIAENKNKLGRRRVRPAETILPKRREVELRMPARVEKKAEPLPASTQNSDDNEDFSRATQELNEYYAKIGAVNTKMRNLFIEIGKHVLLAESPDEATIKSRKGNKVLFSQMKYLTQSIRYNNQLSLRS